MKRDNTDKQNEIQLLSDDEAKALMIALIEGAGGWMQAEELDSAMETTFEWAEKVRLENTFLESILRGKLLVRCGPDGKMEFNAKKEELCEPSESIETDR